MSASTTYEQWLDIREHGLVRLGLAVPRVKLSDPFTNVQRHYELAQQMYKEGVQIAAFPELSISGYSNGHLFQQRVLLAASQEALGILAQKTADMDMFIGVGLPFCWKQILYNCTVGLYRGKVQGVVPKSLLPTYGEFRESLFFRGADYAFDKEVVLLDEMVPFGWDLLFRHRGYSDLLLHCEICEDGWVSVPPSHLAALYGPLLLINNSASNVTGGKGEYRRLLARATSGMCNAARAYVSASGESVTDHSWDGHMIIAQRGAIDAEGGRFQRNSSYLVHDIDLGSLAHERLRQGTHADNRVMLEHRFGGQLTFREIPFGQAQRPTPSAPYFKIRRRVSPRPFVPDDPVVLQELCYEIHNIQAHALADRWQFLPPKTKAILNFSGGKDSLNALGCCVHAARLLDRPASDIICFTLPGYGTTPGTLDATRKIATAFEVDFREISIVGTDFAKLLHERNREQWGLTDHLLALIGHDGLTENLAYENTQTWLRTVIALATGANEGGFMVGTGTLSELAVGWCTMFGDHASHYGVNAGLAKTLEIEVLRWQADHIYGKERGVRDVMHWVCDEEASPELKRASLAGKIIQRTEDFIGPLDLRDFYLYWGGRFGTPPRTITRLALQAFDGREEGELATIIRWQRVFWSRFFGNQHKRNCLPDAPKVGLTCLSPRDWHMPSDAYSTIWLRDLDLVPLT